jgi:DNA topoisomerase VI subunit B
MYGVLTTGKPVKIISKTAAKDAAHYYELRIDTKTNQPEILNGKGEGVDIPSGKGRDELMKKHSIAWVAENDRGEAIDHGTRVTIEMEAKFQRGRGSVEEYLEQTAISNPHARIHFQGPDGPERILERSTDDLPPEPKEIKPHPYGVELGRLVTMLQEHPRLTLAQFLTQSFSRVSHSTAKRLCDLAKLSTRVTTGKLGRGEADALYKAIQETKIPPPATDCVVPIGEQRLLAGLRQVVPGEFFTAATRPPSVYRGNPFVIEAALAYGGGPSVQKVTLEALTELAGESDARSLRQFLTTTFTGMGGEAADKILAAAELAPRQSPSKLKKAALEALHGAMQHVNVDDGQSMTVLRYANRVPLQFQHAACAVTQTILSTNWRSYGLSAIPWQPAERPGHHHGARGQRLGAVHERVEGGHRVVSGDPEGDPARDAGRGPQARHVHATPAPRGPGGTAPQHLPPLPRRSGLGGIGDQRRRSRQALRTTAGRGQEEDGRGRREARRPRQADRGGGRSRPRRQLHHRAAGTARGGRGREAARKAQAAKVGQASACHIQARHPLDRIKPVPLLTG